MLNREVVIMEVLSMERKRLDVRLVCISVLSWGCWSMNKDVFKDENEVVGVWNGRFIFNKERFGCGGRCVCDELDNVNRRRFFCFWVCWGVGNWGFFICRVDGGFGDSDGFFFRVYCYWSDGYYWVWRFGFYGEVWLLGWCVKCWVVCIW